MTEEIAPRSVHVHAVIRQGFRFLMLYSEAYSYCKFPHGEAQAGETPEQAVCRIVSAQTGLTVLPESVRAAAAVHYHADDGAVQEHCYYRCKVSGAIAEAAFAGSDRFAAKEISCAQALQINKEGDHGILSDDARFRAMLSRECMMLRSASVFSPLLLSILAVAGSLLIPLIGGLSCLLFGFHSPTDGGYVYGTDAFLIGLILGIFPAGPAAVISIVSLALSLKNRRSVPQKSSAYILPCIALAVMLLYVWAAFGFGSKG